MRVDGGERRKTASDLINIRLGWSVSARHVADIDGKKATLEGRRHSFSASDLVVAASSEGALDGFERS